MLKSFEVYLTDSPTSESHIRITLENAVYCIWHTEQQNNLMKKNAMKQRSS
jgi:hypothetical protein